MAKQYMQIGEVAERTGLTQRTLRFYEEKGLLAPPSRLEGGFRLYSEDDIQRIEHIVQFKRLLGFSLADIKNMLEAEETLADIRVMNQQEPHPAAQLQRMRKAIAVIEEQESLINRKIAQLEQMRDRWRERLDRTLRRSQEALRDLEAELAASGVKA
ncbi:MAG: MerR family transcriptional regulator [Dehalococcoidia bacterium]|nr:MerR family transcriptional regulator [Dehalococcoidia bacterium]